MYMSIFFAPQKSVRKMFVIFIAACDHGSVAGNGFDSKSLFHIYESIIAFPGSPIGVSRGIQFLSFYCLVIKMLPQERLRISFCLSTIVFRIFFIFCAGCITVVIVISFRSAALTTLQSENIDDHYRVRRCSIKIDAATHTHRI
ncbi:hypothetical protein WK04_06055 [Burkholderia ubonensis]|nr:hypothetical protein WK04_06055 [Burkholderia ubonensis]